jgi:hypothetical protein
MIAREARAVERPYPRESYRRPVYHAEAELMLVIRWLE